MATLTSSLAIGYLNHASGKTITATTSASGYPASNLSQAGLSSSWHSATGSLTSQQLVADLVSSRDIDVIALIGTNLEDDATRTAKTSENSNLSSPEYDSGSGDAFNLTNQGLLDSSLDDVSVYGRNVIVLPGSTKNSQYVGLLLSDSGNPDNHLSGKVFWAGPLWQPQISFGMKDGSFIKRLEPVGNPGLERFMTFLDVSLDVLSEAEGEALRSICVARLRSGRLLVIPRPDQAATWQSEALYCTLNGGVKLTNWPQGGGEQKWKVQLTFKECED